MISIKQILYKTDLRLNKVATNDHQSIPVEDKLFAANEAQLKLFKKKISTNNLYQVGFDGFKKRYEDLQNFVIQSEKVTNLKKHKDQFTYFTFDVNKLKHKYLFLIGLTAICSKGTCKERPLAITKIVKHADLQMKMKNSNYSPSFEYQESLALIAEDIISIYTDGTFDIDYVYVSYIRYPIKMDLEGYIDLDGNPSITQDCELDEYLEDELLDLIQLELALNTENIPSTQGAEIKIKNNE